MAGTVRQRVATTPRDPDSDRTITAPLSPSGGTSSRSRASATIISIATCCGSHSNRRHLRGNFNSAKQRILLFFHVLASNFGGGGIAALICFQLIVSCVLLLLSSTLLFGNGYSSDGGLIGRWVDRYNARQFVYETKHSRQHNIKFPTVQIKATRKTDKSHYSTYLSEILQRHQPNQTSIHWKGPQQQSSFFTPRKGVLESIKITGATAEYTIVQQHSTTFEQDLRRESCHSNWWCQRCLNSPPRGGLFGGGGTYQACQMVCRRCYIRILSTIPGRNDPPLRLVPVWGDEAAEKNQRRIPRIIHQVWHVFPHSLQYPERARIMSTWRSQPRYEHYFYSTKEESACASFAQEANFPLLVVKACQLIPTRIRRQRFLELLILYKHGGILADGDVMLETNLDALIENDTSFVAALSSKSPGLLSLDANCCLWPGLVGAEPGHPILAAAIENILRALLLRTTPTNGEKGSSSWDDTAWERDFMGRAKDPYTTELWKIRSTLTEASSEFVFKNCALGMAWNQVRKSGGGNPLAAIQIGTYEDGVVDGGGKAKILLMSENDAGATRITDIECNLLVASTDLPGLNEDTIQQRSKRSVRKYKIAKQELVE